MSSDNQGSTGPQVVSIPVSAASRKGVDSRIATPVPLSSIAVDELQFGKLGRSTWNMDVPISTAIMGIPSTRDDYARQIKELAEQVAKLSAKLDAGGKVDATVVSELKEQLAQLATAGEELSAPIRLPAPEDIEVRLVSASSLDRLEEYHQDDALYLALFGVFSGSALGTIVGLVAQSGISWSTLPGPAYWMLVTTLAVAAGVFFSQSHKVRRRSQTVRRSTSHQEIGPDIRTRREAIGTSET